MPAIDRATRKNSALPRKPEWKLGGIMAPHRIFPLAAMLLVLCAAGTRATRAQDQNQLPADYVPSGAAIYTQYCAACHGANAKGNGPVKKALRKPAPDLTTLAKRHGGKFPYAYVAGVLQFAPGVPSHGSAICPCGGPFLNTTTIKNPHSSASGTSAIFWLLCRKSNRPTRRTTVLG